MKIGYLLAGGGLVILTAAALTLFAAERRWESKTRQVKKRLEGTDTVHATAYSARELDGLPAPVQRYFRAVLSDGQPVITHARVASRGTFNMGDPPAEAWKPFVANQDFYPGAPGFVWDARIRMAPGISAFVRDAFVDGEGSMFGTVLGLATVVDSHGTPEIAAGALVRYLAEAPWFPTALLPSQGVQWTPLSEASARATVTVGATTVSIDFQFGEDGLLIGCQALRDNDKLRSKQPWGGQYRSWIQRAGMKVPSEAEVFWRLPTGYFPYWRGTIDPAYEFAPPL